MRKKTFTPSEIAKFCQVTPRTVVQWISEGKIKSYQTPGKHNRIKIEDFLQFLKEYNIPIPEGLRSNHSKKRILIVDDDKEMVSSIRRLLMQENKFDIAIAYDGFNAGLKFNEFSPDLVLLDIKMPGVDGYEVCANIRENPLNQHVKVLIISGIIDEKGIKKAKELGADDVLQKPFDNKDLKDKIEMLFNVNQ